MKFSGISLVPKLIDHTAHINKEPIIQGSGIRVFDANQPADPPSTNKNTVYKRLFLNEIPLLKLVLQKIAFLTRKTVTFLYRIFAETERRITCQGGYTPEQECKHSP